MDQPDTREWLSTNGLGGYASGTACGANTRRYHGLLVAALEPPGQRTVLLSRLDETVIVGGEVYELGANFWSSGSMAPQGYHHLKSFQASPVPTWEYQVGLGRLVKRVACLPGQNAVAISYRLEGGPPIRLEMKVLANSRDFHGDTHGHPDWQFRQDSHRAESSSGSRPGTAPPSGRSPGTATPTSSTARAVSGTGGTRIPRRPHGDSRSVEDNYCVGFLGARLTAGRPPRSARQRRADDRLADRRRAGRRGRPASARAGDPGRAARDARSREPGRGGRPVPGAARLHGRPDRHRRLPLVRRLGPRHDDRAARA